MEAHTVTAKLLAMLESLPRERREQLLELAQTWSSPASGIEALPDRRRRLATSDRLDQEYLKLAYSELQDPPDLATVRAALARIPGSLTADCIAERAER